MPTVVWNSRGRTCSITPKNERVRLYSGDAFDVVENAGAPTIAWAPT